MPESNATAPSQQSRLDPLIAQLESVLKNATLPPTPEAQPSNTIPAAAIPAIARCVQAYNEAYEAVIQKPGQQDRTARRAGQFAYRQNLPPLIGRRNIRDFTACIAHGMLLNIIDTADGTRILYAAQVASNTRNQQPARTQKKMQKSAEKHDKSAIPAPSLGEQAKQNE